MASTALSALRRESELRESLENSIADQMVIAADMRPKRFRTKWQRIVYDGPTARKDAESAERDRWSKEKQQAGNRGRSELLGSDHKQARFGNPLTVTGRILHIAHWKEGYSSGSLSGTLLHAAWG